MPISAEQIHGQPNLRRLIELSPDPLAVASLATGKWLAANVAFAHAVGFSEAELRDTDAKALLQPGDCEAWGTASGTSISMRHRDGHLVSLTWRFDRDEPAGLLYCAGRASIEDAESYAALAEREAELRTALEAGHIGLWTFDLKTGAEFWSDEQYRVFGLEPMERPPTREDFLALVHPDDLHLVEFGENDKRPEGTPLDTAFRIIRPDGEVRWMMAHALARFGEDGRPRQLVGVNQDVTERRRLFDAVRASEEQLRQFGEASPDVLWIRKTDGLQLDYLSPGFERVFGFTRQDAVRGDNYAAFLGLVLEADRAEVDRGLRAVVAGERRSLEYRIRRPTDGEVRWLVTAAFPMRDVEGRIDRIGGIDHDATTLKRAEQHLANLLAELQHRVRNTLAVIRSIARRTAETSLSVEDYAMHLDGRIQAFARVQAAATRNPAGRVDLELLVRDELRAAVPRPSQVEISGPEIQLLAGAAETIALALHELTTNAIKHGALAVAQGRISVGWRREDGELVIDWSESGLSLPPEPPARRGFGMELLERTLSYELDAATTLQYGTPGMAWSIRLPLTDRLVAE